MMPFRSVFLDQHRRAPQVLPLLELVPMILVVVATACCFQLFFLADTAVAWNIHRPSETRKAPSVRITTGRRFFLQECLSTTTVASAFLIASTSVTEEEDIWSQVGSFNRTKSVPTKPSASSSLELQLQESRRRRQIDPRTHG